ncbi:maleylpyruvate isomerase [Homoserinimonas aerilata]|uniref:Maleylpyruvate isomerase n=1 Tax=Homoserinimonas aerilata TaxID=1162970 RepID=A0A542YFV9_9MICO|nr:maleylpyruvate isomerase family mycothiol-dependent enzyme [Homoserinimonas aerilata]TQL46975.1 maleylpyruvate isomerase [Homoserinimonas aerilata]
MAARTDNVDDPKLAAGLLLARRGTAFFSRKLNELSDSELYEPSLLSGWTRAHLAAHVGYNARALTRLTEWAATGVETPMYSSPEQRNDEIQLGATLSARALRNLSDHAIVHLNVEWRDLPADAWGRQVRTAQGRIVPVSETVWMRTREVWLHAIDLGNGASVRDLPTEFVDRLLPEVVALWKTRGDAVPNLLLRATDRPDLSLRLDDAADAEPEVLTGEAAQLLAWETGRANTGLQLSGGGPVPVAPRWL